MEKRIEKLKAQMQEGYDEVNINLDYTGEVAGNVMRKYDPEFKYAKINFPNSAVLILKDTKITLSNGLTFTRPEICFQGYFTSWEDLQTIFNLFNEDHH